MDGANLNALMGITRPKEMGVDVIHLNLHKTFSTPHGGGGPGSGPVGVIKELEPFLPVPIITKGENGYYFDYNRPKSIGRIRAFYGNFLVVIKALAYILSLGSEGLKKTSQIAVLNSNYIRKSLEKFYYLPYNSPTLHECVFSDSWLTKFGVKTIDIAKRLMDYGFHPPTIYFPLIVSGALMIEPTESESKKELDLFIQAMKNIAQEAKENPELLKSAPHKTIVRRLDEVRAARNPILKWKKTDKNNF
jgi:glycine dehydrogenase subunit 2